MYSHISSNKRKTVVLLALFVALIASIAYGVGLYYRVPGLFYIVGIAALLYALISYWFSAKISLSLSGAHRVTRREAPELYTVVENLSIAAGLPMPAVYVINDPSPNAFATGRDPKHAAVAATTGLLERLDKTELEGVMAHELAHVGNYDIRLMAVVAALVSVVSIIADFFMHISLWDDDDNGGILSLVAIIAVSIVVSIIATMVQLAISRNREYLADATAALITRYPDGLASALAKIEAHAKPLKHSSAATAHLFIANPLKSKGLLGLLSTHPPMHERIRRLREMGGRA